MLKADSNVEAIRLLGKVDLGNFPGRSDAKDLTKKSFRLHINYTSAMEKETNHPLR